MSKDTPEVGDVFEGKFAKYNLLEVGKVWCEVAAIDKCSDEIRFRAIPLFYLIEKCTYLGKSKANIDDLFKTENEK